MLLDFYVRFPTFFLVKGTVRYNIFWRIHSSLLRTYLNMFKNIRFVENSMNWYAFQRLDILIM